MTRLSRILLLLAAASFALTAHADTVLMNQMQLQHALKEGSPCCVIDGRLPASRKNHPLSDALTYTKGMKIKPTAAVVVVADNNRRVEKIARELDAAYPGKLIIAVKGGVGIWEAALVAASREAASTPGFSFVIPKNTCESGTAIQQLRSGLK